MIVGLVVFAFRIVVRGVIFVASISSYFVVLVVVIGGVVVSVITVVLALGVVDN